MTAFLLSICALDRCLALFDEYRHLNQGQFLVALAASACGSASIPSRRRKAIVAHHRAPSTHFSIQRRRHHNHARHNSRHSLSKAIKRHLDMASHSEIRRRSSAADRAPIEPSILSSAICATTSTFTPAPEPASSTPLATGTTTPIHSHTSNNNKHRSLDGNMMPPPPLPADNPALSSSAKRHSRTDSATRIPNRLSLTLPIALPTSESFRPTPTATASTPSSSIPPTPQEHSALPSPSNVNEFIIAIATKERKVLELREELAREEAELATLKRQFSSVDALHKRDTIHHESSSRTATPTADGGGVQSPRRSVDVDRRSLLLQNQSTPTQKRTAFRGRHARTLSLLSPARTNSEFSVLEDKNGEEPRSAAVDRRPSQVPNPMLAKRASWQPRSQQNSPVVPQLMEDFKLGFKAFVEDIRQITIGDEPVNGQTQSPGHQRTGSMSQAGPSSRAGQATQRTGTVDSPSATASPTPISNRKDASLEKSRPTKSKHFSWTPLGFDSMDDTDWANWESPVPMKSTRWSGSTINSGVMDDIESIPENEEHTTPVKPKNLDTPILSPNKLEEILPNVVNRLSPSNIKRTANTLLDEWEKSLVAPSPAEQANKENTT